MPAFKIQKLVRFHHCDPAGIVFYPQYFMIFNEVVEDWFEAELGLDFRTMHLEQHRGMPVKKTECEFFNPSRLGDRLDCVLSVDRLGTSSVAITIHVSSGSEVRAIVHHLLVHVSSETGRAVPIAPPVREQMMRFLLGSLGAEI
jgi:4-hydroxybenzoyl-CoA thioesterase